MAISEQVQGNGRQTEFSTSPGTQPSVTPVEQWNVWPVNWSAVSVGALASTAAVIVFGLIGVALGAHLVGAENRVVDLRKVGVITLAYSVFSSFFACVIGGWVVGKIAGILRSETAMLHGAISWLVTVPLLILLAAMGAGSYFGGWHGSLAGHPAWAAPTAAPFEPPASLATNATEAERAQFAAAQTEYREKMRQWREDTPRATRNSALGGLVALLMGLVGSVIGGWMASGEPMTLTYYRTRSMTAPTA